MNQKVLNMHTCTSWMQCSGVSADSSVELGRSVGERPFTEDTPLFHHVHNHQPLTDVAPLICLWWPFLQRKPSCLTQHRKNANTLFSYLTGSLSPQPCVKSFLLAFYLKLLDSGWPLSLLPPLIRHHIHYLSLPFSPKFVYWLSVLF